MRLNLKLSKYPLGLLLVALTFACSSETKKEIPQKAKGRTVVPESSLDFLKESGEKITTIKIFIADLPEERNQGLMDVNELPEDVGMLFIFEEESVKSFYMRNTPLPLDIMYVNSDSVIVRIYQNTTPFSEATLPSDAPAQYVVETNGGFSITHGIVEGMKIRF